MLKTAVIYWSATGNTEAMAEVICTELQKLQTEVQLFPVSAFPLQSVNDFDAFALGCPSMGAEQLEESEFEPFFSTIERQMIGKRLALFGSFGWGDGEWMRNWEARCAVSGLSLSAKSVICNEMPDDTAKEALRKLAQNLAG